MAVTFFAIILYLTNIVFLVVVFNQFVTNRISFSFQVTKNFLLIVIFLALYCYQFPFFQVGFSLEVKHAITQNVYVHKGGNQSKIPMCRKITMQVCGIWFFFAEKASLLFRTLRYYHITLTNYMDLFQRINFRITGFF